MPRPAVARARVPIVRVGLEQDCLIDLEDLAYLAEQSLDLSIDGFDRALDEASRESIQEAGELGAVSHR